MQSAARHNRQFVYTKYSSKA